MERMLVRVSSGAFSGRLGIASETEDGRWDLEFDTGTKYVLKNLEQCEVIARVDAVRELLAVANNGQDQAGRTVD